MKIYVASSWRNELQPDVVRLIRKTWHEVYDFRNPHGKTGFNWSDIDKNWETWTTEDFKKALEHPLAKKGFLSDREGMQWAEVGILVLPSGRSSHVEAGWMQGIGMPVYVFSPGNHEPELTYKIFCGIISSWLELEARLQLWQRESEK